MLEKIPYGYQWLNGEGLHRYDVVGAFDFRITIFDKPPRWATGTIYQVFQTRFARSKDREAPALALEQGLIEAGCGSALPCSNARTSMWWRLRRN